MTIVETLVTTLKPWADFYGSHKGVQAGVEFAHVGALLVGGGFAIASDRAALRAMKADMEHKKHVLSEFTSVHKPVLIALSISVLSGLVMLASDIGTFLVSPVYWTKMVLVILLLTNGYFIKRADERLNADPSPGNVAWKHFKFSSIASVTLWLSITLAGIILLNS
jgi:hypothetical protein